MHCRVEDHALIAFAQVAVRGRKLKCDGALGPLTLQALNSIEPARLLEGLRAGATAFYLELVSRRPSNQKFLTGWLKRAEA